MEKPMTPISEQLRTKLAFELNTDRLYERKIEKFFQKPKLRCKVLLPNFSEQMEEASKAFFMKNTEV